MNTIQRIVLLIGIIVIAVMGVMLPWRMVATEQYAITTSTHELDVKKGEVLGTCYSWNMPSNGYDMKVGNEDFQALPVSPELDTGLYLVRLVSTITIVLGLMALFQSPARSSENQTNAGHLE